MTDEPRVTDKSRRRQSVWDYERGGVRLLSRQCKTCIFKPGNPMSLKPGRLRQICEPFKRGEGYMICHATLPYGAHPDAGQAVCRGFYDKFSTQFKQIGDRLRWWLHVDPPGEKPPETRQGAPRGDALT